MNQGDIQDRLRMLLAGDTSVDRQQVLSNLHILPRQGQMALRFPCITEGTGIAFLREIVSQESFDLVVLDNFSTLAAVDDENSASSISDLTNTLLALKSQHCSANPVYLSCARMGRFTLVRFRPCLLPDQTSGRFWGRSILLSKITIRREVRSSIIINKGSHTELTSHRTDRY